MDCVEYMRTLPDNFFDVAICDPPYGDADSEKLGGRFGGRFDRYKKPQNTPPPINDKKPTGIHTQGGTWATKYKHPSTTPAEADSADIRGGGAN